MRNSFFFFLELSSGFFLLFLLALLSYDEPLRRLYGGA